MPARLGVKNRDKIEQAIYRRAELKSFLLKLSEKITIKELSERFGYSIWTLNRDIVILDMWEKIRQFDAPHCKISNADVDKIATMRLNGATTEDIVESFGTTRDNINDILYGRQLRSPRIDKPNEHLRNKLSYREYQLLSLIRKNPGIRKNKLYETFLAECYNPTATANELTKSLAHMRSMEVIRFVNPGRNKVVYYPRYDKYLRSEIYSGSGRSGPRVKMSAYHPAINNFNSYVGRGIDGVSCFIDENALSGESNEFEVHFNRTCDGITKNGVRCGGYITRHRDGECYCQVCGLVYDGKMFSVETYDIGRPQYPNCLMGRTAPPHVMQSPRIHTIDQARTLFEDDGYRT